MFIAGSVSYSSHGSVGRGRRRAPSVRRVSCAVLWRDGYGETFRWSDFPDCNTEMFALNVVLLDRKVTDTSDDISYCFLSTVS